MLVMAVHGGGALPAYSQDALANERQLAEQTASAWDEVSALADRSYARRELARTRLRDQGEGALPLLESALQSPRLEIRHAAARLLDELKSARTERALGRLLSGQPQTDVDVLPGWKLMSQAIGDDLQARMFYARMVRQHEESLRWIDRIEEQPELAAEAESIGLDSYLPISIHRINDGDPVRWGLLLLAASRPQLRATPVLSSRIRGGLLNPQVNERLQGSKQFGMVQRLVSHWLKESSESYINTTMLKIALLYDCRETALQMANDSVATPRSAPAAVATSLTLLARLQPDRARELLWDWTDDTRVCHVWQIMATKRRAVQSQVGDVATALLLYLHNLDPRDYGFADIEADPALIYREFSMGFEDENQRRKAKEAAIEAVSALTEAAN